MFRKNGKQSETTSFYCGSKTTQLALTVNASAIISHMPEIPSALPCTAF